jgi:hypothetical protein
MCWAAQKTALDRSSKALGNATKMPKSQMSGGGHFKEALRARVIAEAPQGGHCARSKLVSPMAELGQGPREDA